MTGSDADLRVYPDPEALSSAAADLVAEAIGAAISERGDCVLALAGGSTPRRLYTLLGERYGAAIDWSHVQLVWGDDRHVPADDPASNVRLVQETLLRSIMIADGNVHPMRMTLPVELAATSYAWELHALAARLRRTSDLLDVALLGLGADGHTASLFPGGPALGERGRWAIAVEAPAGNVVPARVTLTLPLLDGAGRVIFLVAGADKRAALRSVLADEAGPDGPLPAALIRPARPPLWLVDQAAAPDR